MPNTIDSQLPIANCQLLITLPGAAVRPEAQRGLFAVSSGEDSTRLGRWVHSPEIGSRTQKVV